MTSDLFTERKFLRNNSHSTQIQVKRTGKTEFYINEKEQRENVQMMSSAELPDLWEVLCLKLEAQYVFRENFERACPSDIGKIQAFFCNRSL